VLSLLLFAAVAYGATKSYSGHTNQGKSCTSSKGKQIFCPVSFKVGQVTVAGHKVRAVMNLKIMIADTCPDRHILEVSSDYSSSPMPIVNGRFGGAFAPFPHPFKGEKSTIAGTVSGNKVKGTLKDWSHSSRENRICYGKASWSLMPHK
jgi:hypothetical protein